MVLELMLLLAPPSVDAIVNRCDAYHRSIRTMSVKVESTSSQLPGKGVGTFIYKKPSSVFFKMKWGPQTYSYWGLAAKGLELEASERAYDESLFSAFAAGPKGKISVIAGHGYPSVILPGKLKRYLPQSGAKKIVGTEKVGGIDTDHLHFTTNGPSGPIDVDAWVARSGALLKYAMKVQTPQGITRSGAVFSGYVVDKPLPASTFVPVIPRGYMPNAFADEPMPLQAGEQFPTTGWRDSRTGRPLTWPAANRFVAVVSPNCEPSLRALESLKKLSATVPVQIVNVAPKPSAKWAASGLPICHDPAGKTIAKLRRPGTPFFLLVDAKGMVKRLWFGFDPDAAQAFVDDVKREAAR